MTIVEGDEIRKARVIFEGAMKADVATVRIIWSKIVSVRGMYSELYSLTEAEAKRVEMLNGPHGHTYAKALIAQVADER